MIMDKAQLIPARDFCNFYQLEYTFINNIEQHGLARVMHIDDIDYLDAEELEKLEKLVRLHYDLDINLEGAEAIFNLLDKLQQMNNEICYLRNRLEFYESRI
ncbi:hypothetical protein BH09BAC2_BH09BAC2_19790 [soil metagenome]